MKVWVNEDGYREKGYRERKIAELEAKSKSKKTTVTKSMTEKDIMKVWDNEGGYTDALWRADCEQRSNNLKMKTAEAVSANKKMYGGDHYLNMGVQVWDVVETWPIEQQIGYFRGGALKYIMRLGNKDEQLQEAKKAMHYCEKLVEVLEKNNG